MDSKPKIGEMLVSSGEIDSDALNDALAAQNKSKDKLGHVLMSLNKINPLSFYKTVANQQNLPFVDLTQEPPDPHLVSYDELCYYLVHQCLPWRIRNGRMVIACAEVTPKLKHWAKQFYHDKAQFVLTTPRDIRHSIDQLFGHEISLETRTRLLEKTPHLSAHVTLYPEQRRVLLSLAATLVILLAAFPYTTLVSLLTLINLFYIATIGLKFILYLKRNQTPSVSAADVQKLEDIDLPIYTVLVPLYKEKESVPRILSAIRNLDYPKTKLDIKLIVEEDDEMTINAIKEQKPEAFFEMIRVPYSEPRTKPKACNHALTYARGHFVTIYDAEDQPEPLQLKKAVATFLKEADDVICLQAHLNYYNWHESLLARLFAIEYSSLFDFMLPGLQAADIPIPLGGTSNHINLKRLREIGEWDPYNVTEDADLGMRLAMKGYKTQVLESVTLEEAPITLSPWIKQRSRWIKGYMQTWLVYMRSPVVLYRTIQAKAFWGFQFFIGGPCIVFLFSPFLWALTILWWAGYVPIQTLPNWLLILCHAVLFVGIISHILYAVASIRRWKWKGMQLAALLFPFYWLLHSLASVKALWQLIFRPHFWEKTHHGVTRVALNDIKHRV